MIRRVLLLQQLYVAQGNPPKTRASLCKLSVLRRTADQTLRALVSTRNQTRKRLHLHLEHVSPAKVECTHRLDTTIGRPMHATNPVVYSAIYHGLNGRQCVDHHDPSASSLINRLFVTRRRCVRGFELGILPVNYLAKACIKAINNSHV